MARLPFSLLQKDDETRDVPVVVLSADAMSASIERLKAAGVRDYLTKPVEQRSFQEVVQKYLQRVQAIAIRKDLEFSTPN